MLTERTDFNAKTDEEDGKNAKENVING